MSAVQELKVLLRRRSPGAYRWLSILRSRVWVRLHNRHGIFQSVYDKNRWHGADSRSGTGSDLPQTAALRRLLPGLIAELDIRTFLDIPCGDFYWMSRTDLKVDTYIGADIVRSLIESNERKYGQDGMTFVTLDLISDPLPTVDLVFCRDGLVHLSEGDARAAIGNIASSKSTYLLTTTFTGRVDNYDIPTGSWRPVNFERPPFNFPPPIRLLDEQCTEGGGLFADKALGLWLVADLPVA